ncbi:MULTISPECIES: endonuclease Q family protein [unclassified Peribacillus]|uniref:endonuclease Q family protein n=1 Tax=unclassified Peribacillus TaxID=2675266 RepID=UPI0019135DA2|nr:MULTISPECIES: endonuclease Q family protein [unclassified Peribacillus]MBK5442436.1 TIGR00375 family protein [Peribacillus sp. TH24]MBK5462815.1 TIGR00375 family protein [Peribacillus sp. TH27]MBK5500997.1 TIGR00375 family protein [Peribacillus sp. TH14]WMX54026.1 endonuclease Q family protein [Peribacillus sp. R9-11]
MKEYYADLHIHIGRTRSGKAVKITGAKTLTFSKVIQVASERKGLDLIGIIDCHSPEVIEEIEAGILDGEITEKDEGGLLYRNTTIIPGSEIEIYDQHCNGPIHVLAYFPTLEAMKNFSVWMSGYVKNITLSSQRIYCDGRTLQKIVKSLGGLFIPAHVFTPFKSLYGKGVKSSLAEVFDPELIDAIELGLSSDTDMVKDIKELESFVFVTNSDAHSLGKIAREYQKIRLKEPSFNELAKALQDTEGRKVSANYGLNPLLGKYHQTVCSGCLHQLLRDNEQCPECGNKTIIKGVSTRIEELSIPKMNGEKRRERPPYIHQVPLDFIPGLGPKSMEKLLKAFGTEMNILHEVTLEQLKEIVPEKLAHYIDSARKGELTFEVGGGGKYGKVKKNS